MDKQLPPVDAVVFAACNGLVAALLLFLVALPQHLSRETVISVVGIAALHPLAQLFGVPVPAGAVSAMLTRRRTARAVAAAARDARR